MLVYAPGGPISPRPPMCMPPPVPAAPSLSTRISTAATALFVCPPSFRRTTHARPWHFFHPYTTSPAACDTLGTYPVPVPLHSFSPSSPLLSSRLRSSAPLVLVYMDFRFCLPHARTLSYRILFIPVPRPPPNPPARPRGLGARKYPTHPHNPAPRAVPDRPRAVGARKYLTHLHNPAPRTVFAVECTGLGRVPPLAPKRVCGARMAPVYLHPTHASGPGDDEKSSMHRRFLIDVEETMHVRLEQEDTDGGFQISATNASPKTNALLLPHIAVSPLPLTEPLLAL